MIVTQEQLAIFFLIFCRIVAIFMLTPGFSGKEIFSSGKVALIFWISLLLIFIVPLPTTLPNTPILFVISIIIEIIIGLMLGFITQILLIAVEFAGSLMDTQAGLSVASLLDPATGQTTSILSRLMRQIGVIVFFLINGHHVVLSTLVQSFYAIPVVSRLNIYQAIRFVISAGVDIFILGLQIAAPILVVIFLVDFGFGLLSKIAPQVNVFQLGFQLKPIVSMLVLLTVLPGMTEMIYLFLERSAENLLRILSLIQA